MPKHLLNLSDADLRAVVSALRTQRLVPPYSAITLQRIVSKELAELVLADLQKLNQEGLTPQQMAASLELLLADRKQRSTKDPLVDLVTTGAEPTGVKNRDTSVVVRELFATATKSVLVAGYAIYQGQRVFESLAENMSLRPELSVRLFLDIQRTSGDTTASDDLIANFVLRFKNQQWPTGKPLPKVFFYPNSILINPTNRSCLHAKCVVVDANQVFVSSANFSEAAQERNIELGLLLHSHSLATQITTHFDNLLSDGVLEQLI